MATKREQLEKLVHDMKAFSDTLDAKTDGISAEDIAQLNDMGAKVTGLVEEIKAEATASGTIDMAKAFIGDLAGSPAPEGAPKMVDGIVDPKGLTLGDAVAKSPAYEDLIKRFTGSDGRLNKGFGRVPLYQQSGSFYSDQKALVTGLSQTSGGAFTQNMLLGQTVDLIGERRLMVRDLCTNIQISGDTFEYVTVTAKTNAAATVLEATTSATPGLNNVAVGAYTAAHGAKPESALTLAVVTSPVETIAHFIPITRRAAADAPQVRALVDAFLLYGLKEEEEDQIVNGNGTSPNLRGILQVVGINTVGSAGTDIDAVVDAISAIQVTGRRSPTAMVVHPLDWYTTGFLTAKDSAGNYLLANPGAGIDQLNTLWGLRVVISEAVTQNTLLVGDFRQAVVADRMQSEIFVTDSHNDWFTRNLLAVLAEERLGFGVLDPESFCTVTAV